MFKGVQNGLYKCTRGVRATCARGVRASRFPHYALSTEQLVIASVVYVIQLEAFCLLNRLSCYEPTYGSATDTGRRQVLYEGG